MLSLCPMPKSDSSLQLVLTLSPLLQDCDRLRREVSGSVNVAVDAAPGIDLAAIMENMRKQYEELAEKNRQEAKEHFEKQVKVNCLNTSKNLSHAWLQFTVPPFLIPDNRTEPGSCPQRWTASGPKERDHGAETGLPEPGAGITVPAEHGK